MIPKKDLIEQHYYAGRGRNAPIGMWTGREFLTLCKKFDEWVIKWEAYWEKESGCFRPLVDITDFAKQCDYVERLASKEMT